MWVLNGVSGSEIIPTCAGTYKGVLLIMGSSRGVWKDVSDFKNIIIEYDKMAVNYTGLFCGDMQHWVSLHTENFRWMPYLKVNAIGNMVRSSFEKSDNIIRHMYKGLLHSNKSDVGVKSTVWNMLGVDGTSSMFATMVGIALGYNKIILAGIPLDSSGHFFTPPEIGSDVGGRAVHIAWEQRLHLLENKVKSMSGFTKQLLGEPTKEWLNGF